MGMPPANLLKLPRLPAAKGKFMQRVYCCPQAILEQCSTIDVRKGPSPRSRCKHHKGLAMIRVDLYRFRGNDYLVDYSQNNED